METFADKVRSGGGTRFDPMLEEKGGWISGEAPKHDEEMVDAVIGVMEEASQGPLKGDLNPFRAQSGEILPSNLERNFSGFLVRKEAVFFKVDSNKLHARIALLRNEVVIAKFLGAKPNPHALVMWLKTLNQELKGKHLEFYRNVGKGYFFLSSKESEVIQNALMLSPFKSKWDTCMLQSWIPSFNPENPSNLAFPTWVSLRQLPYEHLDQAQDIAKSLGEVIGIDSLNDNMKGPRFCVNLKINEGRVTNIALSSEEENSSKSLVLVDHDNLPFRCRACHSWMHKVKDCQKP